MKRKKKYKINEIILNVINMKLFLTNEFSLKLLFELDKLWMGLSSMSPSSLSIEYPDRWSNICGCVNGFVLACCCGVCGCGNFCCDCCWKMFHLVFHENWNIYFGHLLQKRVLIFSSNRFNVLMLCVYKVFHIFIPVSVDSHTFEIAIGNVGYEYYSMMSSLMIDFVYFRGMAVISNLKMVAINLKNKNIIHWIRLKM